MRSAGHEQGSVGENLPKPHTRAEFGRDDKAMLSVFSQAGLNCIGTASAVSFIDGTAW